MCSSGIGGQAVLEGIMMKNKEKYAVAVRKPNKEIEVDVQEYHSIMSKNKLLALPFIRGVFSFVDSLVVGIKTLTYSASFYEDEEEEVEPSAFEKWLTEKLGDKLESVIMFVTIALSVVFSIALFMMFPLFIADTMKRFIPFITEEHVPAIEGVVKMFIFILYIYLISFMPDIKRTYMYHGAEHKCINCIETGKELSVENVRSSSRFHKRCGTSFLLIVMVISILFFMCIKSKSTLTKYLLRLVLVPVIAGISYEFIRLAGSTDNKIVGLLSKPGLWLQRITTSEPDDSMIEVAIAAVEAVFDWKKYLSDNGVAVENEVGEVEDAL
ncbi:MAG: DUF1385 domain-containing protein [Lachnospiraceae bacterium]|nr:DUF1385 domain-containing protein [Lachnospiraceae bacterium]